MKGCLEWRKGRIMLDVVFESAWMVGQCGPVQGRTWRHAASDERWRRPGREPEADAFEKGSTWERKDLFCLEEDADSQEGQVWKIKIDSRWQILPVTCILGSEFDSQSDYALVESSLSAGHRSWLQRVHVRKDAGKTMSLTKVPDDLELTANHPGLCLCMQR